MAGEEPHRGRLHGAAEPTCSLGPQVVDEGVAVKSSQVCAQHLQPAGAIDGQPVGDHVVVEGHILGSILPDAAAVAGLQRDA